MWHMTDRSGAGLDSPAQAQWRSTDRQNMTEETSTAVTPASTEAPLEMQDHLPKLWQVVAMALIAVAFTAAFMTLYGVLNKLIWGNAFVAANRWTIVVGVMLFSLLVGLLQKYMRAPTVIGGGFTESMKGNGPKTDYRTFPGALLSWLLAPVRGERGARRAGDILVQDIAAWVRARCGSAKAALGFDVAALASALNGIIGNPLFTGVFATEYEVGGTSGLTYLVWNLLAGVIGFSFYELLGLPAFASSCPLRRSHI